MSLLPYRKWIVFAALMCQLLAGTMVHMPVATASPTEGVGTHCPDHVQVTEAGHANHLHSPGNDGGDTNSGHGCKDGCKCPCAHVPAMTADFLLPPATVPHLPVLVVYAPPSLPLQPTTVFRPPI